MKAISDSIFSFFQSTTDFTGTIGTKLYPLVAKEGTEKPFAVYTIQEEIGETKDFGDRVTITLSLYFEPDKYATCTAFADTCKDIIKNSTTFMWLGSAVGFVEDDQSIVANINFETIY